MTNLKRFVNAFKQLLMFVNVLLRTGELIVLNFYPPRLCLAVCNYLIIFVPWIVLQLVETVSIGAKERKRKKIKWENLGDDIWVVEHINACDLYQMHEHSCHNCTLHPDCFQKSWCWYTAPSFWKFTWISTTDTWKWGLLIPLSIILTVLESPLKSRYKLYSIL